MVVPAAQCVRGCLVWPWRIASVRGRGFDCSGLRGSALGSRCVFAGVVLRGSALLSVGVFAGHAVFVLVSGSAWPSWHARGQRFEPA